MKTGSSGSNLDANLEKLSLKKNKKKVVPYLFVQALHMPRSKNSSAVYRLKYKTKRISRLSRSASIRVHVDVHNG